MTTLGSGQSALGHRVEAKLHGGIAVGRFGTNLGDVTRTSLDDRYAEGAALLVEYLRHA